MKTLFKILGISLLATMVIIVGGAILPFSETFKEANLNANQNANPLELIFLVMVNIWFTVSVFYIGKNSDWSKKWLNYSLIFVYMTAYSFMTQIETIFFGAAFEKISNFDPWIIMISNILPLLVIVPLTLKIASKSYTEKSPKIDIKLNTLLKKIGVLAIVYMFVYFLFGYYVAWQFADLREFYSGTAEKQTFIQIMTTNIQDSNIVPFQFLRGVLFSTFVLPIVFMFKDKSKQLLISLILIYLSTAIVLIIPNFLFPDTVRWAHFIEMTTSMTLFSLLTWYIWRK